jgi:prephenate dehydrogenase
MNIGIIGLGLIGGSIAKALKGKEDIDEIVALSRSREPIDAALSEGVIQRGTTDDYSIFSGCDVVYICTPVGQLLTHIKKTAEYCKGIITDAGSTKGGIRESASGAGIRFIGGHPMAGSERSGYFSSSPTLYENAVYVLCPQKDSSSEDVELLKKIAMFMGAIPVVMDAKEHDLITATVSHVPHIEAGALCLLAEKAGEAAKRLAAGGFRDMTRIASGSPEMWTDIALDSSVSISSALGSHIKSLQEIKDAVCNKDEAFLKEFFSNAKKYRDSLPVKGKGAVQGMPQLLLEVPDKPGVLRDVTAILGNADINIKDLSIQNIREYEGGTLRITVQDSEHAAKALELLINSGYECRIV